MADPCITLACRNLRRTNAIIRGALRPQGFDLSMKDNRQEAVKMMADFLGITPAQAGRAYDVSIQSFTDDGMISG